MSGSDAFAYFERVVDGAKEVYLVLMDMCMKVLNWDEAVIKIRAMEVTVERPSVAQTDNKNDDTMSKQYHIASNYPNWLRDWHWWCAR